MASVAIALIRAYQAISSRLPQVCRFYPTCSHYTADAIAQHGLLRGTSLGLWRIARCHPWNPGGVDFVPRA